MTRIVLVFVHVTSAIGIFAALAIEGAALLHLRRGQVTFALLHVGARAREDLVKHGGAHAGAPAGACLRLAAI